LVPGPFLIDTIRFKTGSGALIQEIRGKDLGQTKSIPPNGVRTKDAIATYEVGLENFDSSLFQVESINPLCHVDCSMILLPNPV